MTVVMYLASFSIYCSGRPCSAGVYGPWKETPDEDHQPEAPHVRCVYVVFLLFHQENILQRQVLGGIVTRRSLIFFFHPF